MLILTHFSEQPHFKDTIQKQFTTSYPSFSNLSLLCSILQRYNSKAIHNAFTFGKFFAPVVLNTSKIQFKSNSQPHTLLQHICKSCAQYFKDTIQKQFTTGVSGNGLLWKLCSILQRYNSKAIHNYYRSGVCI